MLQTNISSFVNNIPDVMETVENDLREELKSIAKFLHDQLTKRTPVWEGTTLANFKWSSGAPDLSPPRDAVNSGPTGPTNSMMIGEEPRREANKTIADRNFESLDFSNPFAIFYVVNNAPHIFEVEYGQAPSPGSTRAPNGVFRVSMATTQAWLRSRS